MVSVNFERAALSDAVDVAKLARALMVASSKGGFSVTAAFA